MFTQRASRSRYFPIIFFIALVVIPILFYLVIPTLFTAKPDDIPWAQGTNTVEDGFSFSSFVLNAGAMLVVFLIVPFVLIALGKILGIDTKWITIITILSLLIGIILKSSPLGDTVIWNIMFRFRLEKYDNDVELYLNLLNAGFILAISSTFGAIATFVVSKLRLSKSA